MKLTLSQILSYSKCPKKYQFENGHDLITKPNPNLFVIREIIKSAYSKRTKDKYIISWNSIKNQINKLCFEQININNKEEFKTAYTKSIKLLDCLHHWYYKYFIEHPYEAFTNLTVEHQISDTLITHTYDLILLDPTYKIVPIVFNEFSWTIDQLANNLYIKTLQWLLWKETNTKITQTGFWTVDTSTINTNFVFNKSDQNALERYINFIVRGIEYRIFYPSVNEQCNICPFQKICGI